MFEKLNKQNIETKEPAVSPEEKEKSSRFEGVKEKAGKFLKRLRQGMLILSVIMAADYAEVHSTNVEKISENGKELYRHSDQETNHILNYLSGIDSLTREEQMAVVKDGMSLTIKEKGLQLPENYYSMTEDQLYSYLESINNKIELEKPDSKTTIKDDMNKFINEDLPAKYEYNDTLYNVLWKVEKEGGAPKVRWTVGDERNMFFMNTSASAHYNPLTHTIFIHPGDIKNKHHQLQEFVEELPHSQQFHDNYISSVVGGIQEAIRIAEGVITTHSITDSQMNEYAIPGSIENDAHMVIEPHIKEEFKDVKGIDLFEK